MNDLQKDFLRQSVFDLENLAEKLRGENLSENFVREAFRRIHTIKGTAQAFGFSHSAILAHEIEHLLQAARENKTPENADLNVLLQEGISHLIENLQAASNAKTIKYSQSFLEKIRKITKIEAPSRIFSLELPTDVLSQLSEREKELLSIAVGNGLNLFLIEVGFDFANFETDFKKFKSLLDDAGETAAALPSRKFSDRLGFQFFLTTTESKDKISETVSPFDAEIIYEIENRRASFPAGNIEEIVGQAVEEAKRLAKRLDKEIAFDASIETKAEVSSAHQKIIFDALLHLMRNAVDHAFEKSGTISLVLKDDENGLLLVFSDDGKGIDTEKVRMMAIDGNFISDEKILTDSEILDLIFLPEITTARNITEISGRGVGLDAVKNEVENARGTIGVKSLRDSGTTFEIFLPYEK